MSRTKKPINLKLPVHPEVNWQELPLEVWSRILSPANIQAVNFPAIRNTSHHLRSIVNSIPWQERFLAHFPAEAELILRKQINPDWCHEYQLQAAKPGFSQTILELYATIRAGNIIQKSKLTPLPFNLPKDAPSFFAKIPPIFYVLRDHPQQESFNVLYDSLLAHYPQEQIKGKENHKKDTALRLLFAILCRQDEVVEQLLPTPQAGTPIPTGKNQHPYCHDFHLSAAILFQNLHALKAVLATLQRITPENTWELKQCLPGNAMKDIAQFLLIENEQLMRIPDNEALVGMQRAGFIGYAVSSERNNFYYHLMLQFLPKHAELKNFNAHSSNCRAYTDKRVLSLIHTAAQYGHVNFLKYLIEQRNVPFNLAADRHDEVTPLLMACMHNQREVVEYLVNTMLAAAQNNVEKIKPDLVRAINCAISSHAHKTVRSLFLFCSKLLPADRKESLLSLAWLVHAADKKNESPLVTLIKGNELGLIKSLLSLTHAGKPKTPSLINCVDHQGNTALHLAVKYKVYQVIQLLMSYGADSSLQNKKGKTPGDLANKASLALLQQGAEPCAALQVPARKSKMAPRFFAPADENPSSAVASSSGVIHASLN